MHGRSACSWSTNRAFLVTSFSPRRAVAIISVPRRSQCTNRFQTHSAGHCFDHNSLHLRRKLRKRTLTTKLAAQKDYYELLGVQQGASGKEIKSAFRKKALKLHPDVNSAPDASERFLECKAAYQTLSDPKARAEYDRKLKGGSSFWDYDFGKGWGGASSQTQTGARKPKEEEEFYGFGQFFDDLEKEWSARSKRKAGDKPKSLWDELNELGEEFVEFLETELKVPPEETSASAKRKTNEELEKELENISTEWTKAQRSAEQSVEDALNELKKKLGQK